jgi:DNA-binding CsgD family transcriptional regulator
MNSVADIDEHRVRDTSRLTESAGDLRTRARASLAAVDALLDLLEQRRLRGADIRVGLRPEWRRRLEESGLVVPQTVAESATTDQLHERLLDWQAELVRVLYPPRALRGHLGGYGIPPRRMMSHRWSRASMRAALRSTVSVVGRPVPLQLRPEDLVPAACAEPLNPDGLTDREIGVLRVVAEGLTNAQVAQRLHLSEHTVAAHLRSIFGKARVCSRSAATRYALERGLV